MSFPDELLFQEKRILQQKFQMYLDNLHNEDLKISSLIEIKNILQMNYSNYGIVIVKALLEILDSFLPDERNKLILMFDNDRFFNIEGLKEFLQEKYQLNDPENSKEKVDDQLFDRLSESSVEFVEESTSAPVLQPVSESELKPESESLIEPKEKETKMEGDAPKPAFKAAPAPISEPLPEPKPELKSIFKQESKSKPSSTSSFGSSVGGGLDAAPPSPPPGSRSSEKLEAKPQPKEYDKASKKKSLGSAMRSRDISIKKEIEPEKSGDAKFGVASDDEIKEVPELDRYIRLDYFRQMNPYTVYAYHITVSKKELELKKRISDVFTGEVREQVTEKFELVSEAPIIVDVSFPGCLTTPSSQKISALEDKKIISFFVTPIAKGSMEGKIILSQEGLEIFKMNVKYKVIDQRISKIFSVIGLGLAAVPTGLDMLFGLDMNDQIIKYLTNALPQLQNALTSPLLLIVELGLGAGLLLLAGVFFLRYRSKRSSLTSDRF